MRFLVHFFVIAVLVFGITEASSDQPALPKVIILATGGTIAGTAARDTQTVGYQAAKLGVDELVNAVPALKGVADISAEQILQLASENMQNRDWLLLVKRIHELADSKNLGGIVITHGTDTLEETAYFLNLVLKIDKPIVLVGSMRPATALSADGPLNLYNAVALAAHPSARGRGVLVVLNDEIHAARGVSKTNTVLTNTFRSAQWGSLGQMINGKPYFYREVTHQHTMSTPFSVDKLEDLPSVEIAYGSANANTVAIDAFAAAGVKGIVYAGTGNGSLSKPVRERLTALRKQGIFVVRSSRTGSGMVVRNGENNDDQTDFIASDTLPPQKARILLALALTQTQDSHQIQEMFSRY